jgi:single-strand DNA-binding protein
MNVLCMTGNVGNDGEVKYTQSGKAVLQFSVALNSGYGDKKVTSWIRCNLWGPRADTLAPHITKGSQVAVTGELTNREWTDKEGAKKYSLELNVNDITLLGGKHSGDKPQKPAPAPAKQPAGSGFDDFEDDIPF